MLRRPEFSAIIQIVDANSGDILWPNDGSGGSTVNYQTAAETIER